MVKFQLVIVVPCYNEYNRMPFPSFKTFLEKRPDVAICLVNDHSTDNTLKRLNDLKLLFPERVFVLSNEQNQGKAASVRNGILHCSTHHNTAHFGYLDADLATSLEECYSYLKYLDTTKSFVFASRILKIGSVVERKFTRFFFGRIIATLISSILDIKVYDTQCGCKVFKSELSTILFERPFISKWLFDVELFSRMICVFGKEAALEKMEEIPVKKWIDRGDSKVNLSYVFRLWIDLYRIRKTHRQNLVKGSNTSIAA